MSEKPAIFTIWRDPHYLGGYEIVCWVNDKNTTVQTNIRTREKARNGAQDLARSRKEEGRRMKKTPWQGRE